MFTFIFWCFLLPTALSATLLLLVKIHLLPRMARSYIESLNLVFPVLYSLYFLGSEVLKDAPAAFKKGGVSMALRQSLRQGEWREKICDGLAKSVSSNTEDWRWIVESFRIDLKMMQDRTRYLTALAGAVFFLIMQGIDTLSGDEKVTWVRDSVLGWVQTSSDISQFIGLALFLVLLYLSGSQTHQSLRKYLDCAELMIQITDHKSRGNS
jgi:hypothetical protein